MKRILFVDDEQCILEGLRRLLRPMRDEWEMAFATSGEKALEVLGQGSFDVVISDMRMPGMDGAQLLNEVQRRYPGIVRIVLSGHSDQEMIYQSIGATHQFLAKPCEMETLKDTVIRACAVRELLANESLRSLVAGMKKIPSCPVLYAELKAEAASKTSSVRAIAAIVSKDMGMTAKMLQLVNSAYFGLQSKVATAEQAVNLLGLDTIQALVLTVQIFSEHVPDSLPDTNMDRLWASSVEAGSLARAIAKAEHMPTLLIDQAYTAGLLKDIGVLVLASNLGERYGRAIRMSKERKISICEAEREEFGNTHAEVGAFLLGLWGLGSPIVEAVAFHHCPGDCGATTFGPLTAVYAACLLQSEHEVLCGEEEPSQANHSYLTRIQVADRWPHWQRLAETLRRGTIHD